MGHNASTAIMPPPSLPGEDDGNPASAIYAAYRAHSAGGRVSTDTLLQAALRDRFPGRCLAATTLDLLAYARAGHAGAVLKASNNKNINTADDDTAAAADALLPAVLRTRQFTPSPRRTDPGAARLDDKVTFGFFEYRWREHVFEVFVARGKNGVWDEDSRCYVLSSPDTSTTTTTTAAADPAVTNSAAADELLLEAGRWSEESHDEVWVFDQGEWTKDRELWEAVTRDADWEQVVLDEAMKAAIMRDVVGFFEAREQYQFFGTPWKRGLIFHGTPGNGKTMTVKSIMKTLMSRPDPIPTLYVKTFAQRCYGPQQSVRQIFTKARQCAPCLLLFEDVDSLIRDEVRTYFLNEVDGIERNDGILMIGSTNNLDRLDPGLSKRPSRFDRKYRFSLPSLDERVRYCDWWRSKLADNPALSTGPELSDKIASLTEGFSFAYLKEAFVASLLQIVHQAGSTAQKGEGEEAQQQQLGTLLAETLEKQIEVLRVEMAEAEKSEAELEEKKQGKKGKKNK